MFIIILYIFVSAKDKHYLDELRKQIQKLTDDSAKLKQQLDNAKESIVRLKEENAKYQARLEIKESEIKKLTEKLGFFPKGILEIFIRSYIDVRKKNINVLLLGRSGFGKSALGNSILQRECFKVGCSTKQIHTEVQCEMREFNGRGIGVFELPDIRYESGKKQSEASFQVTKDKIAEQCLHGFPVVLLLLRFRCRITHEYFFLIDNFKATFGQNSLKDSGILVMTCGDSWKLEFEKSFQDWIQHQLF
uniref:AIG1-type G domain-containing protein n=1 Tax=Biomphalaria glabrata TaxID=6526 RepID=A0A2C9M4W3_BIOGL